MKSLEAFVKRILDISLSATLLLLLSPLLQLIALVVGLTSPGPILFRQRRLGQYGHSFELYKFRTMYIDTPDIRNPDGSTFNSANDPRVTTVGRFLRASSLDELPQLFNVLQGNMSLVGPRPDLVDQLEHYNARELGKLQVKPGITGLAQVKYRQSTSWHHRLELDVQYAERWSLLWDLVLLVQTVPRVLGMKNVYLDAGPGASIQPSIIYKRDEKKGKV